MQQSETAATTFLAKQGVRFSVHRYDYNPAGALIGMQAASAMGEDPSLVFKTLMVRIDREKPVCLVVPAACKVNLKQVAALFGGRNARMIAAEEAEALTGFQVGGISPFGQKTPVAVVIDAAASEKTHIYVNAGERGLVVKIAPEDACMAASAILAPISSP
ncbi:Cys-tRNA(Pro)/Cys-tRNA(Cys) deacylase [Gluconacetobacter liquefaciens]|uniref:Cys-tRNA(Pro)/Cys-tRNA(Cys) deacylase n=1 Tax=Gluconacetobacter liquefaciens TaxID=89584 RepID=A0A370G191_GLULI|nr:Cys-tRNA(Pro) deacylase [Gluconacetobacter liquefaciens]MBB2187026.1 Cys-tRNA(Pro) deacylase [Gluconacetobacter liquefaciens]RDI37000.1 Cys-tRNA(Pro)/Cys-tRNA(Cys) deacylase [Gluconacetobacter liquefaciens]GBR05636.1 regulatory protein [Gluconacetobacter liquefaciens NRIC 0522]GEB38738.1 Cys-tRNA(Pro)/Cys-tRNA(Cys) deacylase [Gluconacetobacter liquefaciens]